MRLHLSKPAIELLYSLRNEGAPIHEALQAIMRNPDQPDALRPPERPGRYELLVRVGVRGFWILYETKQDRGESVIEAGIIEN